jgi:hypothetical protein
MTQRRQHAVGRAAGGSMPLRHRGRALGAGRWMTVRHGGCARRVFRAGRDQQAAGFGGVVLQGSPSLCIIAFGLPRILEQLPQRAVQAALAIRHLAAAGLEAAAEGAGPVVRLAVHLGRLLVEGEAGEPPARWLAAGETLALPVRL